MGGTGGPMPRKATCFFFSTPMALWKKAGSMPCCTPTQAGMYSSEMWSISSGGEHSPCHGGPPLSEKVCAGNPFRFVADAVFRHHGAEQKTDDAIRLQEAHSTYAMLKTYEDDILRSVAFSLANGTWLLTRAVWWTARGRLDDVALLLRGWGSAYVRYLRARY